MVAEGSSLVENSIPYRHAVPKFRSYSNSSITSASRISATLDSERWPSNQSWLPWAKSSTHVWLSFKRYALQRRGQTRGWQTDRLITCPSFIHCSGPQEHSREP